MNKNSVHRQFVTQLEEVLTTVLDAARHSFETATDAEFKPDSKYDTFSLEQSYLARGQAARVESLAETLKTLRAMEVREFAVDAPVDLGAVVEYLGADGDEEFVYLTPAAGGEEVEVAGARVSLVQAGSPLGQAMRGKRVGESFRLGRKEFQVTAVL